MTTTRAEHRATALAAVEETCPRCGARRGPDQQYCLECGLELPVVSGRIASLRRRWIRRLGWYPGDWIWASLVTLTVAIAGAAVAIALTNRSSHQSRAVAPTPTRVTTTSPVQTTAAGTPTPKPAPAPSRPNGSLVWPANRNGWTVVLASYPRTTGRLAAVGLAHQAARRGVPQVGILDSNMYPSLQPGYDVVFSGIYGSNADAQAGLPGAHQAGFSAAYPRQIAR